MTVQHSFKSSWNTVRNTHQSLKKSLARSICSKGAGQSLHLLPSLPNVAPTSGELEDDDDFRLLFLAGDDEVDAAVDAVRFTDGIVGLSTARRYSDCIHFIAETSNQQLWISKDRQVDRDAQRWQEHSDEDGSR